MTKNRGGQEIETRRRRRGMREKERQHSSDEQRSKGGTQGVQRIRNGMMKRVQVYTECVLYFTSFLLLLSLVVESGEESKRPQKKKTTATTTSRMKETEGAHCDDVDMCLQLTCFASYLHILFYIV